MPAAPSSPLTTGSLRPLLAEGLDGEKKDRVDEFSALTALVILVVERIITEEEILVIIAPLYCTPATNALIFGAQTWCPMDFYTWPKAHA